jgi:hypothetical protein
LSPIFDLPTPRVTDSSLEKNKDDVIDAMGIEAKLFDFGSHTPLAEKDRELIQQANCSIFIVCRENELTEGVYSCAPWIQNEGGMADMASKPILFFAEKGVELDCSVVPLRAINSS